jgi:hypothetical protein
LTVSRVAVIGAINTAAARIRATLTTLLPSASPSAIRGVPFKAELIETVSSGLDVAKAATVVAMMPAEIRMAPAMPTVPRTKSSPPAPAQAMPIRSAR